jgi:hypothetical protein
MIETLNPNVSNPHRKGILRKIHEALRLLHEALPLLRKIRALKIVREAVGTLGVL